MPSLSGFVRGLFHQRRSRLAKDDFLRRAQSRPVEISRADWKSSRANPTEFYERCFRFFHTALPAELRDHRQYFSEAGRGFGEEAFHTMWYLLFQEFRPASFLEIGVFRGQTLSYAGLLQRRENISGETVGISPFQAAGDSVSRYAEDIEYQEDTLANVAHFGLPRPTLLKAFSTDPDAVALIGSRVWDCIYIDGNHDYEIALADWKACSSAVRAGGLIVLDDSGLSTRYEPPAFATKGHPGPSRVAEEIDRNEFKEILQVGHNRVFQKLTAP